MPTAPDVILAAFSPATPTAPTIIRAAGGPAAPSAPANALGTGAVSAPSAPAPAKGTYYKAKPDKPIMVEANMPEAERLMLSGIVSAAWVNGPLFKVNGTAAHISLWTRSGVDLSESGGSDAMVNEVAAVRNSVANTWSIIGFEDILTETPDFFLNRSGTEVSPVDIAPGSWVNAGDNLPVFARIPSAPSTIVSTGQPAAPTAPVKIQP